MGRFGWELFLVRGVTEEDKIFHIWDLGAPKLLLEASRGF